MKIAVLGGGNGSFAAAGDFCLSGHAVRLWRQKSEDAEAHMTAGGRIGVIDQMGSREAKPEMITSDIAAAVEGADLIVAPVPAFAQQDIATKLAPHLRDGQVVYLPPGTFGSYIFARAAKDVGNRSRVSFAETGTLPWLARKQDRYVVRISTRAVRLPTGVFPAKRSFAALALIDQAFPNAIEPSEDALSAALMNAGPIIHPPLIIMNAGPIEHFDRWDIHKEGTQPAIRRVTDQLDNERIAVREALGYGAPHFPLANHYKADGEIGMYPRDAHDQLTGSNDWREHLDLMRHRYMLEDTRLGLSFLSSVAKLAGVPVPLANAFLNIGSVVAGQSFESTGRTLNSLGLNEIGVRDLKRVLAEGFEV
ncbi:NAD/NADP-dependent octopine/nopaline dehydrogenase family protein [Bradyrhizobium sp. CCBAU 53338]|uniref:NAD/NADP-dependent octopine/nopaline dehydrogenase family protein n=1 Tax=Bradyrhizobium sp. CCBAU 53338 TaxID=1325111 RepID=UPI00188D348D|nr:NAD/NADP-dependent octopine/nopaline dehydrogenase family protein [Bradyrhizobium sp. CCBAU 53338]QOZ52503.1 glycerol-3-phosphate dehydrogenase [Bradyrhizobium sp. CCBAU 53338]